VSGQEEPRRRRLTYANVASTLALMLAVGGGSAFAASKLITGKQIAKGTITATNIKSHSLLSSNFKKGQIPGGATGATGATGANGANGANGAPGTAIAYGTMVLNGLGNPTFGPGAVGFTSVTEPQPNIYCINIPAGSGGITPMISNFGGNNNAVFSTASAQQCSGQYEIAQQSGNAIGSGQGFTILIP
jgi:hypothetical protein